MNTILVLFAAGLLAQPVADEWSTLYKPSAQLAAVVRGQTPGYDEVPAPGNSYDSGTYDPNTFAPNGGYDGTFTAPPGDYGASPYAPAPQSQDPFLNPGGSYADPYNPYGGGPGSVFGVTGPQPFRFGWTGRHDVAVLPSEDTRNGANDLGDFGVFEWNNSWEYTTPISNGWIFAFTQQFNIRNWDGPASQSATAVGLPGSVFRVGWDFEWTTPANNPWSLQLGFNPAINSDFERHLTRNAYTFDGRTILFYRVSPSWMLAGGFAYWDRVDDRFIPYGGVIWTPDDRHEYRLVFPNPRISYFIGNPFGCPTWIYAAGEYRIETYQVQVTRGTLGSVSDQIQLEDWRLTLGIRSQHLGITKFFEAGWIFGRDVEFVNSPGFEISSGFIARAGFQY